MQETWIQHILSEYGLYIGTFIICFISGFIPVVNTELVLIFISSISTRHECIPVALISGLGQMTAKAVFYYAGRGSLKISLKRYEDKINETIIKMKKWESKMDVLIFLSASIGFPPFYFITIASGMIRHRFPSFFMIGLVGRILRFGFFIIFPQFCREIFF